MKINLIFVKKLQIQYKLFKRLTEELLVEVADGVTA